MAVTRTLMEPALSGKGTTMRRTTALALFVLTACSGGGGSGSGSGAPGGGGNSGALSDPRREPDLNTDPHPNLSALGIPAVEFGAHAYFVADDGLSGEELWRTDGTDAGTTLVKDIVPGESGSSPDHLTPFRGKLYFPGVRLDPQRRVVAHRRHRRGDRARPGHRARTEFVLPGRLRGGGGDFCSSPRSRRPMERSCGCTTAARRVSFATSSRGPGAPDPRNWWRTMACSTSSPGPQQRGTSSGVPTERRRAPSWSPRSSPVHAVPMSPKWCRLRVSCSSARPRTRWGRNCG